MKNKGASNLLAGILFLSIGAFFWLATPAQVATDETGLVTARTFPHIALGLIIFSSMILLVKGGLQLTRDRKNQGPAEKKAEKRPNQIRLWMTCGLLVISVVVGQYFGLLIAGLLVSNGMLGIYRTKQRWHYALVATIVVASYYLFKLGFRLNLP